MSIHVFYDGVKFRLKSKREVLTLIEKVIRKEKKIPDGLNFIFTGDEKLLDINKEFLKHNYFTDVIAFGYPEGKKIKGEIYISCDTVKRNAINYKVSLYEEIIRVMIHGTLHLCGYDDRTEKEKKEMAGKEDYWLKEVKRGK